MKTRQEIRHYYELRWGSATNRTCVVSFTSLYNPKTESVFQLLTNGIEKLADKGTFTRAELYLAAGLVSQESLDYYKSHGGFGRCGAYVSYIAYLAQEHVIAYDKKTRTWSTDVEWDRWLVESRGYVNKMRRASTQSFVIETEM